MMLDVSTPYTSKYPIEANEIRILRFKRPQERQMRWMLWEHYER